ncbi:MAG: dockerin type I domain-containing protein [Chthoniobacterales bacterium]
MTNAQNVSVSLTNVTDTFGNTSASVTATMGVLLGDTSGNGTVNASDVSQTKAQAGQAVTISNFRTDVNANGSINSSDVAVVKSQAGTSLPTP